jgi:hypothetical protein
MKQIILLALIAFVTSCNEKKDDLIPELTDKNLFIKTLKFPGLFTINNVQEEGYFVYFLTYSGEKISSIAEKFEANSISYILTLSEFEYADDNLKKATKYSSWSNPQNDNLNIDWIDTSIYEFERNEQNQQIIMTMTDSESKREYYFESNENKKEIFTPELSYIVETDSLLNETTLYRYFINQDKFGNIKYRVDDSVSIISLNERPNPLNLIYRRLDFPYITCLGGRFDMTKLELLENCVDNYLSNGVTKSLLYDYDSQGRVISRYWSDSKNKEIFEYY